MNCDPNMKVYNYVIVVNTIFDTIRVSCIEPAFVPLYMHIILMYMQTFIFKFYYVIKTGKLSEAFYFESMIQIKVKRS